MFLSPKWSSSSVDSTNPMCAVCKDVVNVKDDGCQFLQCSLCKEIVHKDPACSNIGPVLYDCLNTTTDSGLRWFCSTCRCHVDEDLGALKSITDRRMSRKRQHSATEAPKSDAGAKPFSNSTHHPSKEMVLGQIFSHMGHKDLCHASMMCKEWYDVIHDTPSLWHRLFIYLESFYVDSESRTRLSSAIAVIGKHASTLRSLTINIDLLPTADDNAAVASCKCFKVVFKNMLLRSNFHQLKELTLMFCFWLDSNVVGAMVSQIPAVESLDLYGCEGISDECAAIIGRGWSKLRKIKLENFVDISDEGVRELLTQLASGNLQSLQVTSNENDNYFLSDATFSSLGQHHGLSLTKLELNYPMGVGDDAVINGISLCRQLEVLKYNVSTSTTNRSLRAISTSLGQLKELRITFDDGIADNFTPIGMAMLASLSQLEYLDLGSFPMDSSCAVTLATSLTSLKHLDMRFRDTGDDNTGFNAIARCCCKLEFLKIHGNASITGSDLKTQPDCFPCLKCVRLFGCTNIDYEFLYMLAQRTPKPDIHPELVI